MSTTNASEKCVWNDLLDVDAKRYFYKCLLSVDLISSMTVLVLLSLRTRMWMYKHVFELTYNNFTVLWMILFIRSIVQVLMTTLDLMHIDGWSNSCEINAFTTTFLAVLEVEMFTHVCIERYVVTKYITKGWSIVKNHYTMYVFLSLFFAFMYSAPIYYMNLGRYSFDFTCDSCTYAMVLPNTWKRYLIVVVFLLRSVKPAVVMVVMLIWTYKMERQPTFNSRKKQLANVNFTKVINWLVFVNLALWAPIAVIRGWILWEELLYHEIVIPNIANMYDFRALLQISIALYHISPAVSVYVIYSTDTLYKFDSYDSTETYNIPEILARESHKE